MNNISRLIFLIAFLLGGFSNVNAQNEGLTYGVFIAIDDYSEAVWKPLKTSVNDANAVAQVLSQKYVFDEIITLYNKDATQKNILNKLDEVATKLTENDQLLIFYSGHGFELGNEGYWVAFDAIDTDPLKMVSNTQFKKMISTTKAKHVLLMADACFSGTAFKASNLYIRNDGEEDYYKIISGLISRQAIISGSLEPTEDENGEHSIFTKYLLKYLENNENQYFSTSELYELMKYPLAANSTAIPKFGHIQNAGHEGGQFVFQLADIPVEEVVEVYQEEVPIVDCSTLKVEIEEGKK
ncbi:MAG: caspase family protein [Saprospiraceae bacterium]|nr:caspase family protein [Saprospiraceae bacterium]